MITVEGTKVMVDNGQQLQRDKLCEGFEWKV